MRTVIDIPFMPSETLCEIPGGDEAVQGPRSNVQGQESAAFIPSGRWNAGLARRIAERIVSELMPGCHRVEIAGSLRRGRPHVGDIDLVVLPKDRAALRERLARNCRLETRGDQNVIATMANGLQLDVFMARDAESSLFDTVPSNWGTLLLCRTGSKEFNVWLAQQAKAQGLHWNPYRGVEQRGQVIAGETEEAVLAALGVDWVKPEDRER